MRVETYIHYDLDINEVAMMIHRVMKELQKQEEYQTITTFIERTYIERKEINPTNHLCHGTYKIIQKYSLLIIASQYKLNKEEVINILKKFGQFDPQRSVRV